MSEHLFGRLCWLGRELQLAVPHPEWFAWLENFTGLDVERQDTPARPPVLSVIDDHCVLVDDADLRLFENLDQLKAWLFLTVSDVLIMRGGFIAFHAAGLAVGGEAVLVSGPPWSGKSSWAFEAQHRGVEVLGDDQVVVDVSASVVFSLPRPMKRRLASEGWEQLLSPNTIRSRLDDELIALEPRRTNGLAPVDRAYPVRRIVHLARHPGAGVDVTALSKSEAHRAILNQIRGYGPTFRLTDAAATARMLGRVTNIRVSVGDGEIGRAMDAVLDVS